MLMLENQINVLVNNIFRYVKCDFDFVQSKLQTTLKNKIKINRVQSDSSAILMTNKISSIYI